MVLNPESDGLRASLRSLRQQGVAPEVAVPLAARQHAFVAELLQAVTDEVPAYRQSGNPEAIPELERHLGDIVARACRLLTGEAVTSFNFVSEHACRRAAQKFPLDAILHTYRHAYRGIHRLLLRWIREAALEIADETAHVRRVVAAVSDFAAEYTGMLGTLLTSEYVEHTRVLAEAEGDRRTRLMDTLLRGYDESDRVAARLLRRAGYLEQRQSYCVAVARSVDPREMENPARAQRMADALAEVLSASPLRQLIAVRDNHVVAIVADRVYPLLRQVGPAALIGLSNDVPSTSHIPRAASEARLALDFANVANRVMLYSDIPFRRVLVTPGSKYSPPATGNRAAH
jgi:hypothetical protein